MITSIVAESSRARERIEVKAEREEDHQWLRRYQVREEGPEA